jgi:hypothetical protein
VKRPRRIGAGRVFSFRVPAWCSFCRDFRDGGAGGGFIDDGLVGGVVGDEGLDGEVVDGAGVAGDRTENRARLCSAQGLMETSKPGRRFSYAGTEEVPRRAA